MQLCRSLNNEGIKDGLTETKNPTLRPDLLLFFRVKLNHDFRRDFLHTTANEHDGRDSSQSRTQSSNEITDLTREANQALVDRSNEHTSDEANQQTDGFESLFHV